MPHRAILTTACTALLLSAAPASASTPPAAPTTATPAPHDGMQHLASPHPASSHAASRRPAVAMSARAMPAMAMAATVRAVRSGRWRDPRTWSGSRVPVGGARVLVPAGRVVVLDGATASLRGLTVEGTLTAPTTADVAITSAFVDVEGGVLRIGTERAPHTGRAVITLTGPGAGDDVMGMGSKVLAVMDGTLDLHGATAPVSWTTLGATAQPGSRTLRMASAPHWRAGDRIVVATSSTAMSDTEVVTVRSVSGSTVTLTAPLRHRHLGVRQLLGPRTVDTRAEVGLLSHTVVVRGDASSVASRIGGHAMFMGRSTIRIQATEFTRMGQANRLGRYPVHFHLMGNGCTSCYVRGSSVHDTLQRGIVLHDTSRVTLARDVVYNTVGHDIVVETATTTGNTISGNLALVNRQPRPSFTAPVLSDQNDRLPATFWFRSAANTVTGNHSAGSFTSGFIYDGVPTDQRITFTGNTVHAAQSSEGIDAGDFDITAGVVIVSGAVRAPGDVVSGLLSYHNAIGMWPEGGGPFVIGPSTFVDNGLQTENRGVDNRVRYVDPLFAARLPVGGVFSQPTPVHLQYGGDVEVVRPVFVGYRTVAFDGTDTMASQASVEVSGARFVGARPQVSASDLLTSTFTDDTLLPHGTYVTPEAPWLTVPGCSPAPTADSGLLRCPVAGQFRELLVRTLAAPSVASDATVLTRSDGVAYSRQPGPEMISGLFGPTVVTDAGFTFSLPAASAGGYVVGLSSTFLDGRAGLAPLHAVELTVPSTASPGGVWRTTPVDGDYGEDGYPAVGTVTPGQALTPAASLAAFRAAPAATYYYDAVTGLVHVSADDRWVVVAPS